MNRPTRMALLGVWLGAAVVQAQTEAQTQTDAGTAQESAPASATSTSTTSSTTTASEQPAVTGPQVQAEIVSVDAAGKTVTVRESAEGDASDAAAKAPATLPVEGNAVARLGFVKAGSRVTLICAAPAASTTTTTTTTATTTNPASSEGAGSSTATDAATATDTATATESTTSTTSSKEAASTSGADSAGAPAPSESGLNATCGSVVEIAKARATTTE